MIADGTLKPGGAVPSGAALAVLSGCSVLTARAALRALVTDGTLMPGVSRSGRLRVALAGRAVTDAETARTALAHALAARRRACGPTQPQLARVLGLSVTTIGHAETGRLWQSRTFWEKTDQVLGGTGQLPGLYDDLQAARAAQAGPEEEGTTAPDEAAEVDGGPCSCGSCVVSVVVRFRDGREVETRPLPPSRVQCRMWPGRTVTADYASCERRPYLT